MIGSPHPRFRSQDDGVKRWLIAMVLAGTVVPAAADPTPDPDGTPLPDPPPKKPQVKSLRDEAVRVATELAAVESRRDPEQLLEPWPYHRWFTSAKAGKLEAAAAGATFVGEAVLGLGGSPIAAFAAFAAGATLDAAAADAEAASPPPPPKKKVKQPRHRLR